MDMVIISIEPKSFFKLEIIPNCSTIKEANERKTLESKRWYIADRNGLIDFLEEKLEYLKGQTDNGGQQGLCAW